MDDFPDDAFTLVDLPVGGVPLTGNIENRGLFQDEDQDWFRVNYENPFGTYRVFVEALDPANQESLSLRFGAGAGESYSSIRQTEDEEIVFKFHRNISHFVGVLGAPNVDYRIAVEQVDEPEPPHYILKASTKWPGWINESGDTDRYWTYLIEGQPYAVEVIGENEGGNETLSNSYLKLSLVDGDNRELVAQDDDSGDGTNALVRYTPATTAMYELEVSSSDNGVGSYTINLNADDDYPDDRSSFGSITIDNGIGTASGVSEVGLDIDWFKVELEQRLVYAIEDFEGPDSPSISGFHSGRQWLTRNRTQFQNLYYQPQQDEEIYVVHRHQGLEPEYNLEVSVVPVPLNDGTSLKITEPFENIFQSGFDGNLLDRHQFVSTVPLIRQNNTTMTNVLPGTLTDTIQSEDFYAPYVDHAGEIFFRRAAYEFEISTPVDKVWGNWTSRSVLIQNLPRLHQPFNSENVTDDTFVFSFANSLPTWYEGSELISGFAPFGAEEADSMRSAIRAWDEILGQDFVEAAEGTPENEIDIHIFKSTLANEDLPAFGFHPGDAAGGDIVFSQSFDLSNTTPGSEGFYEMLRAVGNSLGLAHVDYLNRDKTIVGLRTGSGSWSYPSSPQPHDLKRAASFYGASDVNITNNTWHLGGPQLNKAIFDNGGFDTLNADFHKSPVTIDLRPGLPSYSGRDYSDRRLTLTTGFETFVEKAVGGSGNDWISGSEGRNWLVGNPGNDVLLGRQGFDFVNGGSGDDRYRYRLGDGDDRIFDGGLARDRDTLDIISYGDLDFSDDMAFRRDGDFLIIDLEPNSVVSEDREISSASSITINMENRNTGIEILSLFSQNSFKESIDLRSVYDQATPNMTRFTTTDQRSAFGQLAVPVV